MLLLTGASGAMDGPFSQFVTTKNAFLRMAWKFQGVFVLFMAFKLLQMFVTRSWSIEMRSLRMNLTVKHVRDLIYAAIGLIGMQSFLSWGAIYTIMAHANLFSSLSAILIVLFRLSTCRKVTPIEILGSFIALIGCFITTFDSKA